MALKDQSIIGLTFGQIISIIVLFGGLLATYTDVNVKIANIQVRTEKLEQSRSEEKQLIETNRTENREALQKIEDKLDLLLIRDDKVSFVK